jgi:hypothetical protein
MSHLRDGPTSRNRRSLRWLHWAALGAACVAMVLLAIGTPFWHTDTPGSEATCPICHLAHMPVLPGAAATVLSTPTAVAWVVPAGTQITHAAPAALDSPPRAPPA